MAVTQRELNKLKAKDKRYEVVIGDGLVLDVFTSGKKVYRFRTDNKKIKIGDFDLISLEKAKEIRDRLRIQALDNPEFFDNNAHSFQSVFEEWIKTKKNLTAKTQSNIRQRCAYLLDSLGSKNIQKITSKELLNVVQVIDERGCTDLAHRVIQTAGQIFRFGIAHDYCKYDLTPSLHGALTPKKSQHYPTITDPREASSLLRDIDSRVESPIMRILLSLHIYFFCRPGELRQARWAEFTADLWRIPAERMKMKREHLVPLATQAQTLIKDLYQLTGYSEYLFPSPQWRNQPLCENAENAALKRLGNYSIRGHGFRAMAATMLREKGYSSEIIEKQLSHEVGSSVSRAYNHAEYLDQRRTMMQDWADYVDKLKRA